MTACNDQFQMLAVLSASGELDQHEYRLLTDHAETCPTCRQTIAEMSHIASNLTEATFSQSPSVQAPKDMQARFIARAIASGIPLQPPTRPRPNYILQLASFAVVTFFVVTLAISSRHTSSPQLLSTASQPNAYKTTQSVSLSPHSHPLLRNAVTHPKHTPRPSPHFNFSWPQNATGLPKAFEVYPQFSASDHATQATVIPVLLTDSGGRSPFHYAIDLASLHLQEPPRANFPEISVTDLSFIPTFTPHP